MVSLAAVAALTALNTHATADEDLRSITTYESAGLYWTAPGGRDDCRVRFRPVGQDEWRIGFDLWFDARNQVLVGMVTYDRRNQPFRAFDGAYSLYESGGKKVMIPHERAIGDGAVIDEPGAKMSRQVP